MKANTKRLIAWALYDWANSAFPTVVITFIIATYFTQRVASNPIIGASHWGYTQSIAGLCIALLSPLLGAIADHSGFHKRYLLFFTLICIVATAAISTIKADPSFAKRCLWLVGIATVSYEIAIVFYNAMLPRLATANYLGRVSGWAWALGYAGGLACLLLCLPLVMHQHMAPAATAWIVAAWFSLFSLPLFITIPETTSNCSAVEAIRRGVSSLLNTLQHLRSYKHIAIFLLARMFYIDGINTIFAFGGIFAASSFGLSLSQIILFGIGLNVTAGLGALIGAWVDDGLGSKTTIQLALLGIIATASIVITTHNLSRFIAFALLMGCFFGPVQAASRSFMAGLSPAHLRNEMFGLYALSGKATAYLGPWLLAWVTALTKSTRYGMATILFFLVVGSMLLILVNASD